MSISNQTLTGNTVFNVAAGATVTIAGGNTISGTLSGSGTGMVDLTGNIFLGSGGLTLDFSGNMLQWTGGAFQATTGNVTNEGTITLAGSAEKQIFADGTFYDYGTIIQTGSGDFGLHSDNISPTTLLIEPGAFYLIESDAGVNNEGLGDNVIQNEGTIRKTAGTGTSTLLIPSQGYFSNTGTVEADAGTLYVDAGTVSQISSATLTGGTWNAANGTTLQLPTGTSINTNQANLSLAGAGASITGIAGLSSNSGSLTVSGVTLSTSGSLSNSGTITLGPAGTLAVDGGFTQTSGGTLNEQIGGTPASGQFGQLAVTGTANLAGTFNLTEVNGFTPVAGTAFPVITFGQSSGSFGTITGLGSVFTQDLEPTSIDLVIGSGNPVDLAMTSVTAATTANVGQQITVDWQVKNESGLSAAGNWQDSVYLSPTPTIGSSSVLLGTVVHSGGLASGTSYSGSLAAAVPTLAPGNYYVIVDADSLYQEADVNRANNVLAATTGELDVTLPALTLGTATNGSFSAAGQSNYYQVTVPAGGSLVVSLASAASSGATALYISQGTEPTPYNYQESATVANLANQTVVVPQVLSGGTYFILAQSVSGSAATAGYTIAASQSATMTVSGIGATSGGNAGNVTIEIDGTNFTTAASASLSFNGNTINASSIKFASASQIFATFNLTGAAVGAYTLKVQQGQQTATAPSTFQVTAAEPSNGLLTFSLGIPQLFREGRTGTIVITYTNNTPNDIVSPVLDVVSTNPDVKFSTPDDPNTYVNATALLAVANSGPAGILRPGQSGQLTVTLLNDDMVNGDRIPIAVLQDPPDTTLNWATQESNLQPPGVSNAAWSVIYSNLMGMLGTTTNSYNAALAQAATYLGSLGESAAEVSDVSRLWSFLISQANAAFPTATLSSASDAALPTPGSLPLEIDRTFDSSIAGPLHARHLRLGLDHSFAIVPLGRQRRRRQHQHRRELRLFPDPGQWHLPEYQLRIRIARRILWNLHLHQFLRGAVRLLAWRPVELRARHRRQPNHLRLQQPESTGRPDLFQSRRSFATLPTIDPLLQRAGLRVAGERRHGGRVELRLRRVGPPDVGHRSGPHGGRADDLLHLRRREQSRNRRRLLSVTSPDGVQQNFSYSATTGALVGSSGNGGAGAITYAYLGEAEIQATDSQGNQSTVWYNDLGLASRVQSPLGGITNYFYDDNGNLLSVTDAEGNEYQYTYNSGGNLTQTVNPLGQTTQMTYNSLGEMTSLTDANDNTTQYNYNAAGNLLAITYPDGTGHSFSYDPLGNLSETVGQNGDPISYQYNALGLVTQQTFADGSYQTMSYDAHGNLLTALTYSANGTLTSTTTLTYNAANELTSIDYPGGLSLAFSYNAQGQRVQSVDQNGYTINYSYDSQGLLSKLTDGSDNLIVQYSYNSLAQVTQRLNGNGTYTTYSYDGAGNLTSDVNYSSTNTINSSFSYTYNVLNEVTSMTDSGGNVTSYGYDALGQLTQVSLPGGGTISYAYNAAGDRTQVVTSGNTTAYSSNDDNEITAAGSATYTYNANGDLATVTDSDGTTSYAYNDLNQLVSITNPDGSATELPVQSPGVHDRHLDHDRRQHHPNQLSRRSDRRQQRRRRLHRHRFADRQLQLRLGTRQPDRPQRHGLLRFRRQR